MTPPTEHTQGLWSIRTGIRSDVVFTRQLLRGAGRYVVHDPVTFQNHVFDPLEYRILNAIVPDRTLGEVFAALVEAEVLAADDRAEFHDFVVSLHRMGLLQMPVADAEMLYQRWLGRRTARRRGLLRHLVYLKVPLVDPDRWLERTVGVFGRVFSRVGLACWLALLTLAVWKCWGRFDEIFAESGSLLELTNIPVLFLGLVILKVIHEFGHAYACKRLGCEVPEMGVVLLFMTPCAYVDASASWKLESRWHRIVIGLAGMYVEVAVAACFALVWAATPPGLLHDVAVNVIALASVVTVFFNLNPLMRFDGYYVFSDLVGIPNLWERSRQHLRRWARYRLLGIGSGDAGETPAGERGLYLGYGLAAFVYRIFLGVAIVAMALVSWPLVGTLLGIGFAWAFLVRPLLGMVRYLLSHPETAPVRGRARLLAYAIVVGLPLAVAYVPVSHAVVAPAALEAERAVVLRAPGPGFVADFTGREGDVVGPGVPVVALVDEELELELAAVGAEQRAAQARLLAAELTDPAEVAVQRARLELLGERLARLRDRLAALSVAAPTAGRLVRRVVDPGTFVAAGAPLAEVHGGRGLLRMVLTDHQVVRTAVRVGDRVTLRWRLCPDRPVTARVCRILPAASRAHLPQVLTVLGGGPIYGAVRGRDDLRADRAYSHVLLAPDWVPEDRTAGLTASVRVTARAESVGSWLYRRLAEFYVAWRMT